jgi:hypothetical protein
LPTLTRSSRSPSSSEQIREDCSTTAHRLEPDAPFGIGSDVGKLLTSLGLAETDGAHLGWLSNC